jgi:hypothetical protein
VWQIIDDKMAIARFKLHFSSKKNVTSAAENCLVGQIFYFFEWLVKVRAAGLELY